MDEGPFRMPRSVERSATNRPESFGHSAEESQPEPEKKESKPVQHRTAPSRYAVKEENLLKRLLLPGGIVIAVIVVIVVGWIMWPKSQTSAAAAIDGNKYQAVFLTNSQVYFGKLQALGSDYFKLTNIYYLQSNQSGSSTDSKNPQQTNTDQNADVQLIKLGSELHGPDDEMIVSKDQVLFFENLKSDGKVSKSISQYQTQNK